MLKLIFYINGITDINILKAYPSDTWLILKMILFHKIITNQPILWKK